jgi:hypothetical protein
LIDIEEAEVSGKRPNAPGVCAVLGTVLFPKGKNLAEGSGAQVKPDDFGIKSRPRSSS